MINEHFHMNGSFVFISNRFACVTTIVHLSSYELLNMGYSLFNDRGDCVCKVFFLITKGPKL